MWFIYFILFFLGVVIGAWAFDEIGGMVLGTAFPFTYAYFSRRNTKRKIENIFLFRYYSTGKYYVKKTGDLGIAFLILSAAVMKADRKYYNAEANFIRKHIIKRFGHRPFDVNDVTLIDLLKEVFNQRVADSGMELFHEIINSHLPLKDACKQINKTLNYEARLQLLYFLFQIARVDRKIKHVEIQTIHEISILLLISDSDYNSTKAMFVKESWSDRLKKYTSGSKLNNAYQVMGIDSTATDDEVKKAFRSLAKKHHPDKIAHLGDTYRASARAKFQNILSAYQLIKKNRGMD
jgi:DnaJ like chaperone protein